MTTPSFPSLLQGFFTGRLMQQRQASPHTIGSYRDSFRLFLQECQSLSCSSKQIKKLCSKWIITR